MLLHDNKLLEDKDLFSLLKKNDRKAFAEIYKRHNRSLYQLSLFYLKDSELAKDIVQDVFMLLWELRFSICIQTNLGNYLYTTTKNIILKTILEKNKEVMRAYEMEIHFKSIENELQEKIRSEKRATHLYKAIEKLPKQKKEVCLLKLNQNLSNQEIAQQMGVSIQTVKNHYNQSLKFLKFYLQNDLSMLFPLMIAIYINSTFIK